MGIGAALRAVWHGLRDVWRNGYAYIWANVAFFALCLPVVTAPAAFAALCHVTHTARSQPWEADLALFWQVFRARLWRAMPWGLAHLAFVVVNMSNLAAYMGRPEPVWIILRVFWWASAFVWWGVFQYTWFLYEEMETPSLRTATRNALIMVLVNPIFTLIVVACQIVIFSLSVLMPPTFVLLTFSVTVAISSAAVQNRLDEYRRTRVE
ncbi:DUF624 domain-containing protein [bacterium]|nr:DUF624 domain-containing protein [bacterium]